MIVRGSSHDLEITNSIIKFISVFMMHYLKSFEHSSDVLFHNMPMFPYITIINSNGKITRLYSSATSQAAFICSIPADKGTVFSRTVFTSLGSKSRMANKAFNYERLYSFPRFWSPSTTTKRAEFGNSDVPVCSKRCSTFLTNNSSHGKIIAYG